MQSLLEPAAESETCLRVSRNFTHKLEEHMVSSFAGECVTTGKENGGLSLVRNRIMQPDVWMRKLSRHNLKS